MKAVFPRGQKTPFLTHCVLMSFDDDCRSDGSRPPPDRSTNVALINAEPEGGGSERDHDGLRTLRYPHADLFLLFFSVANRRSFERVSSKWDGFLRRHEGGFDSGYGCFGSDPNAKPAKKTPWLLVGTMCDKRPPGCGQEDGSGAGDSSVDAASCVTWGEGEELARSIGALAYVEISALTGVGMAELAKVVCEHLAPKTAPRVCRCAIM